MKKLLAVLFFLGSVVHSADLIFAGESIDARYYNDITEGFLDMPMRVYYHTEEKTPIIIVKDILFEYRVHLDPQQLKKVSNIIAKYFKWEKIAIQNEVEVNKEIGRIKINLIWNMGNDWDRGRESEMVFTMDSPSANRHRLRISFTKARAIENHFLDFKPQTLYFYNYNVEKMQQQLSPQFIKSTIVRFLEKEKKRNELFK